MSFHIAFFNLIIVLLYDLLILSSVYFAKAAILNMHFREYATLNSGNYFQGMWPGLGLSPDGQGNNRLTVYLYLGQAGPTVPY